MLLIILTITHISPHNSHYLVLGGVIIIFLVGFSHTILSYQQIQQKIIDEGINVKSQVLLFSGISIMVLSLIVTFIAYIIKNRGRLHSEDIGIAYGAIVFTLLLTYVLLYFSANQIIRALEQTKKLERILGLITTILLVFFQIFLVFLCIMIIFLSTEWWFITYIGKDNWISFQIVFISIFWMKDLTEKKSVSL